MQGIFFRDPVRILWTYKNIEKTAKKVLTNEERSGIMAKLSARDSGQLHDGDG